MHCCIVVVVVVDSFFFFFFSRVLDGCMFISLLEDRWLGHLVKWTFLYFALLLSVYCFSLLQTKERTTLQSIYISHNLSQPLPLINRLSYSHHRSFQRRQLHQKFLIDLRSVSHCLLSLPHSPFSHKVRPDNSHRKRKHQQAQDDRKPGDQFPDRGSRNNVAISGTWHWHDAPPIAMQHGLEGGCEVIATVFPAKTVFIKPLFSLLCVEHCCALSVMNRRRCE